MNSAEQLLLDATRLSVVDRLVLPPRPERLLPTPSPYCEGATGRWLKASLGSSERLRRHQALGLASVAKGAHVAVCTGTASGKTHVFMTAIMHELLNGTGKTLVLYPQKALSSDQLARFQTTLMVAGLPVDQVCVINGDVKSDREELLEQSRIILATPDIIQCWLLRQVRSPAVQRFLAALRFLVIDEAHALSGIFGSNAALMLLRLRSAQASAAERAKSIQPPLQIIAASATMREPEAHLKRLTGCDFEVIGEADNGAPFHGLTLLHIDGPDHGIVAEKLAAEACRNLAEAIGEDAFILFADTRQGTEHITRFADHDQVVPYRGGYNEQDRRSIESRLHDNQLRGVVSTSALELGIDIPQFVIGLNLGLPQTRKALHQRIGRIGRSTPGVFGVITPASTFAKLGQSFKEYFAGEVETSHLYLENRFIQFQAARCLIDEAGEEGGDISLPDNVEWPSGFADTFAAAQPCAVRPRDLDHIASIGGDCPHINFPFRAMCETTFALRDIKNPSEPLGTIDLEQALREASPGATYHHRRRAYRVVEWRTNSYDNSIMLQRASHAEVTRPLLGTDVGVSLERSELLNDRLLAGDAGSMAEIQMRVNDSVNGYRIGSTTLLYRDLSKTDKRLFRKRREFMTTGVLLRNSAPWFSGESEQVVEARHAVSKALAAVLAREHCIAPAEIRTAHDRIAIHGPGGARRIHDAIVIFDNVAGGLRLCEPLFSNFEALLCRLACAAEMAGEEAFISGATVERLKDWYKGLSPATGLNGTIPAPANDELIVYAPGTAAAIQVRGTSVERLLLEPQLVAVGDNEVLMYRYEPSPGATGWVAHDRVEPVGSDWARMFWNSTTNEFREVRDAA
ncbi:MAG TPA: DEAD/DEAH box helicase [Allosphingosinicella sp.]|nr:DEAD/DEAH box helicase [Allosphingosinicella sp.]